MVTGVTARDLPRLICDEPEYCFGTLSNTNDVPHTFVLANEGEAPLAIYRVQTDCGCTRVRLEDKIIHPGEQIAVQVRLILKGRAGHQHKRVTIVSNDPDHSRPGHPLPEPLGRGRGRGIRRNAPSSRSPQAGGNRYARAAE